MAPPTLTAAWLATAIGRAKRSTLPAVVGALFGDDDTAPDIATAIDAIEAALLTVVGVPTEASLHAALRPVVAPYAVELELPWETIADAILAALDGPALTPVTPLIDTWGRR